MADIGPAIRELLGEVPPDLTTYFEHIGDGALSGREDLELNLLSIDDAMRWTKDFRGFHPVVSALRGVVLDDANTSDHHVYLALPVCCGVVLHLAHDGESRIVFPSLDAFVTACEQAKESGSPLGSHHPAAAVLLPNQAAAGQLIRELLDGQDDCDGNAVVLALIPSLDLGDFALMCRLASDDDFYIAEALGDAIAKRPRSDLAPVAELCARHAHSQAAAAGKRALAAIKAL